MNVRECEKRKIIQSICCSVLDERIVKVSREIARGRKEEEKEERKEKWKKKKIVRGYHVNTKRDRPTWGCSRAGNCTTPQNVSCRGSRSLWGTKEIELERAGDGRENFYFFFFPVQGSENITAKEPNKKGLVKFYRQTVLKRWGEVVEGKTGRRKEWG